MVGGGIILPILQMRKPGQKSEATWGGVGFGGELLAIVLCCPSLSAPSLPPPAALHAGPNLSILLSPGPSQRLAQNGSSVQTAEQNQTKVSAPTSQKLSPCSGLGHLLCCSLQVPKIPLLDEEDTDQMEVRGFAFSVAC